MIALIQCTQNQYCGLICDKAALLSGKQFSYELMILSYSCCLVINMLRAVAEWIQHSDGNAESGWYRLKSSRTCRWPLCTETLNMSGL